MLIDGRLVALGACAVGLTVTWLRGRGRQRRGAAGRCSAHRSTRVLPRGRPLPASSDELSLVSYNILCQRYANSRRLPHVFAQYLDPEYRWQRLQSELAAFGADVIALQEVTVDRWMELKDYMASLGYCGVLQERGAAHGSDFMLAIFYRPEKLRLVWHEERSRALLAGLAVVAEGPAQGQMVWVVNVHLEGSPYRPNDRVSQLKHALQRLEHRMGSREVAEAANVVVCGDFNSTEHDSPCWLLRRGRLERNHTDACCPQVPTTKETIAHPFPLHEAYTTAGYRPPFTRKVGRENSVMDFIWCSRHMPVSGVMRPLQQELRPLVDKCYLPNRWHPSDHLPVGAVMRLTPVSNPQAAAAVVAAAAAARGGVGAEQAMANGLSNGTDTAESDSWTGSVASSPRSTAGSSNPRPV